MAQARQYVLSLDAGGTMTDALLTDPEGNFVVGKALTNRQVEVESFLEATSDVGKMWNLAKGWFTQVAACNYTGTTILNTVITRTGKKVGLLITKGWEDNLLLQRGLTWLGQSYVEKLHQVAKRTPRPLIAKSMIEGVNERINFKGEVVVSLSEDDVRSAVERLVDRGAQVIAICFLWSPVNPVHEQRASEIARQVMKARGLDLPIILSSQVAPVMRETSRLNSLVFEAYAAEQVKQQLLQVERGAKDNGYLRDLLTVLSYGGLVNIRYPRMYETIISGPVGGVTGGKYIGDILKKSNIVCCDMGGTSFDVGIIAGGIVPIIREPDFAGIRLNLPMVHLNSIEAGTGTVIHLDPLTKRLDLGPESVGSDVGVCFRSSLPTVGDCDLLIGYLDPDSFLGGKIKLDKEKSYKGLKELADSLKVDVHDFAWGIIELIESRMRAWVQTMLLARGYNSADFVLMAYGGAGPMHMAGFTEGIPFADILTVPYAAAFSAFGNATADYAHRYHSLTAAFVSYLADDAAKIQAGQTINAGWERLEERAYEELAREGIPKEAVSFRRYVYACYRGQLETFEAESPVTRIQTGEDMDKVISAFEDAYSKLYPAAMRMAEAGYQISELTVTAIAPMVKPKLQKYELGEKQPSRDAFIGEQQVYYKREWRKFNVWDMDSLNSGNEIHGPALVRHPMTTLVIPPGHYVYVNEFKFLWYRQESR